jgi:hypothetical protein
MLAGDDIAGTEAGADSCVLIPVMALTRPTFFTGWSDPAHVELTPMPMMNNAMASAHAAVAKAFATVVRFNIVIIPSQKVLISASSHRESISAL